MSMFAHHMAAAIEATADDLENIIGRIKYNRPHLTLTTEKPWVAFNSGNIRPEMPFRVCDLARDYGYYPTVEEAREAAARMQPSRPFRVVDSANDNAVVAEFPTREWAEKFARAHAKLHGSTLDYESFRNEGTVD